MKDPGEFRAAQNLLVDQQRGVRHHRLGSCRVCVGLGLTERSFGEALRERDRRLESTNYNGQIANRWLMVPSPTRSLRLHHSADRHFVVMGHCV